MRLWRRRGGRGEPDFTVYYVGQPAPPGSIVRGLAWHDRQGRLWFQPGHITHPETEPAYAVPTAPSPNPPHRVAERLAGRRWQDRRRSRRRRYGSKPVRPVGREIPYDVARYVALDLLFDAGVLAGFSLGGPPGMAAGFLLTAVARGVVSGTIGVIRARAARRWEMRQEGRHLAGYHKDRRQDVRLTNIEAALARLGQPVAPGSTDTPTTPSRDTASQAGRRWRRRRSRRRRYGSKPVRPVGREIPYDVARYVALDLLFDAGVLAGFSLGGPPGMAAGFLLTAVARGVVSGTIGVIRARAARRWEMRQEGRHLAGYYKDRRQDVRLTNIEAALARLGQPVAPGSTAPAALSPGAASQVGRRWRRGRSGRRVSGPIRPVGREIPYDVARYVALDLLSGAGVLAGFSLGGPPGMAAGFLLTAVARGVVSGTIGVIRARAARRWEMRQEGRHLAGYYKDREQDVRLTNIEAALARLGQPVAPHRPPPSYRRVDNPWQTGHGHSRYPHATHSQGPEAPTHQR